MHASVRRFGGAKAPTRQGASSRRGACFSAMLMRSIGLSDHRKKGLGWVGACFGPVGICAGQQ